MHPSLSAQAGCLAWITAPVGGLAQCPPPARRAVAGPVEDKSAFHVRRRKRPPRDEPSRSLIFSEIWPRARSAARQQADVIPPAAEAPCAITTIPSSPSSAAPP